MIPTLVFGATSVLARRKKTQLMVIGIQFAYIAYKIMKKKSVK